MVPATRDRAHRVTIVSDAVSSLAPDLHAATSKNFAMKFEWVAHRADLLPRTD
jgi:nicotinamidase-related amidase